LLAHAAIVWWKKVEERFHREKELQKLKSKVGQLEESLQNPIEIMSSEGEYDYDGSDDEFDYTED